MHLTERCLQASPGRQFELHWYMHDMACSPHSSNTPCQLGGLFKLQKSPNSPSACQCHHCPASALQHVLSVLLMRLLSYLPAPLVTMSRTISDSESDSHSWGEEVGFIPETPAKPTKVHSENWMCLARARDPASTTINTLEELYTWNITVPSCHEVLFKYFLNQENSTDAQEGISNSFCRN